MLAWLGQKGHALRLDYAARHRPRSVASDHLAYLQAEPDDDLTPEPSHSEQELERHLQPVRRWHDERWMVQHYGERMIPLTPRAWDVVWATTGGCVVRGSNPLDEDDEQWSDLIVTRPDALS